MGSMLAGLMGGAVGAEMINVVNGLLDKHGGVSGLVSQLESGGLANTVKSWVGSGPNEPVTGQQLQGALGPAISELATKMGISPQDLSGKLASILPQAIDKLTPNGVVPKA
jgi:uncharacterized protein YidB (DUF937 family)